MKIDIIFIVCAIGMLICVFGLGYVTSDISNLNANSEALEMCKISCYDFSLQFLEEGDISISGFYDFACVNGCYTQAIGYMELD